MGLETVVGYIVAEQKNKTWTPISCVLTMQRFAQKDGCPDFFCTCVAEVQFHCIHANVCWLYSVLLIKVGVLIFL